MNGEWELQSMLPYPRRPVVTASLTFFALSAFVGGALPFLEFSPMGELPMKSWPLLFGFCAFTAFVFVGLMRLGTLAILFSSAATIIAFVPGIIGMPLVLFSPKEFDIGKRWMEVSSNLIYALLAVLFALSVFGWSLYLKRPWGKRDIP